MKNVLKTMCLLALAVVIALPLTAEDKKEKKKKKGGQKGSPTAALVKRVKDAGVEGETLAKVEAIAKAYGEKIAEANKAIDPEIRKKQAAARKAAVAEGKKGKDVAAAVAAAVQLTDEQEAAMKEVQALQRKLNAEVAELLTPDQREKAKLNVGKGNAPKKKKKKNDE